MSIFRTNKLTNIKIISIDLFRTLVDVDRMIETVWRIFLRDDYRSELAREYWDRGTEILMEKFEEAAGDSRSFKNCRAIFEQTYSRLFEEINLDFDPKLAAEVLVENHKSYHLFDDTRDFLDTVGEKFPICLSSDCDIEMIVGSDGLHLFDHIFISEVLRSYKLNPAFFQHVIDHYGAKPGNILHIGDSKQDIICPKQLGLVTCWVNRKNEKWSHPVHPDFEVNSLADVVDLLGLKKRNPSSIL